MHLRTFALLPIIFLSCVLATAQSKSPRPVDHKLTSLKAMLFYDNKGTFSPDVAEPDTEPFPVPSILWNTPMEGASREGASTSVLVTVEVEGEYVATALRKIELTARYKPLEGKREIVIRRLAPIAIRENGKFVAGFWVEQAGCNPVKLSARIVGQRQSSTMKRIIKFGCGE